MEYKTEKKEYRKISFWWRKKKCKILVQGVLQRLTDAYGVLNLSIGTRQSLLRVGMPEDREMPKKSVKFLSSFL